MSKMTSRPNPPGGSQWERVYAKKYCFKATTTLVDLSTNRRIGTFTAFGKTPDISSRLQQACMLRAEKRNILVPDSNNTCENIQLSMCLECPAEATGEILFAFEDEGGNDMDESPVQI